MCLPSFKIKFNNTLKGLPDDGNMIYEYSPFYNLKINKSEFESGQSGDNIDLASLRLKASEMELSIDSPIELDVEESYDGSANIVLNDRTNPLKIVNSRFYLTSAYTYKIGDRKGNIDTNIYTRDNFKVEAKITKSVQSLVKVDFLGLIDNGKMPIGNYTFYFKLSDSDGNESDFIAESGKVVCHIGNINQPHHIRGGQLNENSNKSIKLRLNNLDMAYSYVNVYYVRNTEHGGQEISLAYKINDKYKINGVTSDITITGYEDLSELDMMEIQSEYAEFSSVNSAENCQNILFAGNITNEFELYKQLEKLSLFVVPEISFDRSIGNLTSNYTEEFNKEWGYEYYNTKNIYYSLGYWNEEIYRFGIMYILNDYTLSPVFNIRGVKELTTSQKWLEYSTVKPSTKVNIQDDYSIEGTKGEHNSKGVFRINLKESANSIFSNTGDIKPLGLKFNFLGSIVNGLGGLKELTKGFVIVRQKRIPTILAQSVGISTSKHGSLPLIKSESSYIIDSFLQKDSNNIPKLGKSTTEVTNVYNNALLCPEASMRTSIYNSYFDSSEYTLKENLFQPKSTILENRYFKRNKYNKEQYELESLSSDKILNSVDITASLMLIESGTNIIRNGNHTFSSKAGDRVTTHDNVDVVYGDFSDPANTIKSTRNYNLSTSKVRGEFNSYIGVNDNRIKQGTYYNIYQKGYNFNRNWKEYFKLRYNDSTPYYPVSDRIGWNENISQTFYRGDCYINTYSHRMNWNFIDPEFPGTTKIVDPYTWFKNYRVHNKVTKTMNSDNNEIELQYNKLLPLFTFKYKGESITSRLYEGNVSDASEGIIDSEHKKFKTYAQVNGEFGYTKMNRIDVNSVGLGQWVTFKVFSNSNLAMRDVDLTRPDEEAQFKMKRAFYPFRSIDPKINLPESTILNRALSKSTGDKMYFNVTDKPFYKTNFSTRIYYSNALQKTSFINGNRVFLTHNYEDYTVEYGKIVKLVEWYGSIIAVMEHGVLLIPINEQVLLPGQEGQEVSVSSGDVLSKNPRIISNSFGSLWADSIIKTDKFIYGIDTVAKKIWRTNGQGLEIISDMAIQQYLNDNIKLSESDRKELVYFNSIKTHYNAFKTDIMFVFNYNNVRWNMCWNESLEKWTTQYTWFPEFSENINNIFYTFGNKYVHENSENYLYKHGFAGVKELEGDIKPAYWYDEQHPFEFEFVINDVQGVQKIFDNLKIISNNVEPNSLIYEITGDGFDWAKYKEDIYNINKKFLEEKDGGFDYEFPVKL